jgi:hypothetical protein
MTADSWKELQFTPIGEPSIVGKAKERFMSNQKLDYNRGVFMVHMGAEMVAYYPDDPGTFYDIAGNEVSEETARRVVGNAEVLRQSTERRMKEAKAKAFANIEAQHKAELAALETQAQAEDVEVTSIAPTSPSKDISELASDGERTWKS